MWKIAETFIIAAATFISACIEPTVDSNIKKIQTCGIEVQVEEKAAGDLTYNWEQNVDSETAPILVFIHGGNFYPDDQNSGLLYNRNQTPEFKADLKKFNIASVDYSLFSNINGVINNVAPVAYDQIKEVIKSLNNGQRKICVMGHSFGAQVAASLAAFEEDPGLQIDCFVGLSGIYNGGLEVTSYLQNPSDPSDISYINEEVANWLVDFYISTDSTYKHLNQPSIFISYIPTYTVPTMLIYNEDDTIIDKVLSVNFANEIATNFPATPLVVQAIPALPVPDPQDARHRISPFAGETCGETALNDTNKAVMKFLLESVGLPVGAYLN